MIGQWAAGDTRESETKARGRRAHILLSRGLALAGGGEAAPGLTIGESRSSSFLALAVHVRRKGMEI
jgi:hypothetical protein